MLAAAGLVPLMALPPLGVLAALALITGACFAPITLTQNATIDEVAPKGVAGQAFAFLGSAYLAGVAGGTAVSGALVDGAGVRAALALARGATLAAACVAALGFRGQTGSRRSSGNPSSFPTGWPHSPARRIHGRRREPPSRVRRSGAGRCARPTTRAAR